MRRRRAKSSRKNASRRTAPSDVVLAPAPSPIGPELCTMDPPWLLLATLALSSTAKHLFTLLAVSPITTTGQRAKQASTPNKPCYLSLLQRMLPKLGSLRPVNIVPEASRESIVIEGATTALEAATRTMVAVVAAVTDTRRKGKREAAVQAVSRSSPLQLSASAPERSAQTSTRSARSESAPTWKESARVCAPTLPNLHPH